MSSSYSLQPTACSLPRFHVVAGALFDAVGRVLIAQRPAGKHMAGGWEFPGGKLEPGEERLAGLTRELQEELGIDVIKAEPLISYQHIFAERCVLLDLWVVERFTGSPHAREGQPLQWAHIEELDSVGLLEADRPMIAALRKYRRVTGNAL